MQRDQHRLGPRLRQGKIPALAALGIGMSGNLDHQSGTFGQDSGQRIDHTPRRPVDFGRARLERDLAGGDDGVQARRAFLGRGQGLLRVALLVIADIDLEGLARSQLVGQDLADAGAGVGVAGDARHLDHIGADKQAALLDKGQRLDPGQHAHRPAVGQIGVQPRRRIDGICAKESAGKAVHGGALQLVGQAPAQFHPSLGAQRRSEFGRTLHGLHRTGLQGSRQRKHRRQRRLQVADHAVKDGLLDLGRGQQRHVGVRKGDGCGAQVVHGADRQLGRLGPSGRGHAKADSTGDLPRHPCRRSCGQDPRPCPVRVGGAGVKARAARVLDEPQGKGRQDRPGCRNVDGHPQRARRQARKLGLEPALFVHAVGNRGNCHLIG